MENNENIMPVNTTGDHIVAQALETALGSKVEKEDGKGLSSNDYTDAEKEKLAGLENYTLPDFTYRNLCLNSRGDNLNCWRPVGSSSELSIDYTTFGYPVIKMQYKENSPNDYYTGLTSKGGGLCDNWPDITCLCNDAGGKGSIHPIMVSYDIYSTVAHSVSVSNMDSQSIPANKWTRVSHTVPAGSLIAYLSIGASDLRAYPEAMVYYKNIQIEYGTEATPYCYNPTLPFSLEEQIVPHKFFPDRQGQLQQVYRRTFKFQTDEVPASITLATGIDNIVDCSGTTNNTTCCYNYENTGNTLMWVLATSGAGEMFVRLFNQYQTDRPLYLTVDYTKA